jgi:two-component system LytT family response regulator
VVTIDKVQWIEADGNYVKLHTAQGTFRPRMTLASLESRLDPSLFVRIHRSHLVSVSAVKEVQPWFHGDFRIVLASGETLPLSRRFRERLKFG